MAGRTSSVRIEALNAFNNHNLDPANHVSTKAVGGLGGINLTNYELDGLLGTQTSRLVQFIVRFNFQRGSASPDRKPPWTGPGPQPGPIFLCPNGLGV